MDYSRIKMLLTEKGVSFSELTDKIGMSRRGLYAAIDNKTLSITSLEKISEVLNVPVTYFFDNNQDGWITFSDANKLKDEISSLKIRINELEEQLDDKRMLIQFIKDQNLIPASFIINKGRDNKIWTSRNFDDLDSLLNELESSLDDQDREEKFKQLINWYNERKKGTSD